APRAGAVRAAGAGRGGVLRPAEGDGEGAGRSVGVGPNPMGPAVGRPGLRPESLGTILEGGAPRGPRPPRREAPPPGGVQLRKAVPNDFGASKSGDSGR